MSVNLPEQVLEAVRTVIGRHPNVQSAILYGSRAKGNSKPGSDIDLTLTGNQLSFVELLTIETELEALDLPYSFDVSAYRQIINPALLEHISRVGQTILEQTPA